MFLLKFYDFIIDLSALPVPRFLDFPHLTFLTFFTLLELKVKGLVICLVSRSLGSPTFLTLFVLLELKAARLVIRLSFLSVWPNPISSLVVGTTLISYKYYSKGGDLGAEPQSIYQTPTFSTRLVQTATFWHRLWGSGKTAPTKYLNTHKLHTSHLGCS